jgi:hypothetical protein
LNLGLILFELSGLFLSKHSDGPAGLAMANTPSVGFTG